MGAHGPGGGAAPGLQLSEVPSATRVAEVVALVPVWRVDRRFDYVVPDGMAVEAGFLVRIPFGGRRVRGIVTKVTLRTEVDGLVPLASVVVAAPLASPASIALLDRIALRYATPSGRVFRAVVPPRVRVPRIDVPAPRTPSTSLLGGYPRGSELIAALRERSEGAWCVRPLAGHDPGDLAAEVVAAARPRQTLVAVPEVRHGSLIRDRVTAQVGDALQLDSSRPDMDRAAAMIALAGGAGTGVGGRAAVLAPAGRLGAFVLCDEQHPAFKDDRAPRYDARWVALTRARLEGAAAVLLSATPSLETAAAVIDGKIGLVEPDRAALRAARPHIETFPPARDRTISHELHTRIRETLATGRTVALVTPRGGFARAGWCSSCRRSLRCGRCDGVYVLDGDGVRCPRCGASGPEPAACPVCATPGLLWVGAGTVRLEEQLRAAFPRARVARVDKQSLDLSAPEAGADIYVMTWIGTKPELRPDVGLVGVLDADAAIRRADLRSAEHAYRGLAELAAWAGPAGRLVIHTADPGHHAIQAVVRADLWYFVERELPLRAELGYPPYGELIRLVAAGEGRDALLDAALAATRREHARVLGPIPGRVPGETEALVKCDDAEIVAAGLRDILAAAPAGTTLRVDTDPR